MARTLETPLPARTGGHRTEKYPFGEWMTTNGDGAFPVVMILQGEDYNASHASMRSSLKGAAKKRGLDVETRSVNDATRKQYKLGKGTEGIIFQAKAA